MIFIQSGVWFTKKYNKFFNLCWKRIQLKSYYNNFKQSKMLLVCILEYSHRLNFPSKVWDQFLASCKLYSLILAKIQSFYFVQWWSDFYFVCHSASEKRKQRFSAGEIQWMNKRFIAYCFAIIFIIPQMLLCGIFCYISENTA